MYVILFINKQTIMANIVLTEDQLQRIINKLKPINEDADGNKMAKQQLFTIATLAYKMWESLEENGDMDDWMESKIAQAEQSITSVVKAYFYDEFVEGDKGMGKLNFDDLVIGQ